MERVVHRKCYEGVWRGWFIGCVRGCEVKDGVHKVGYRDNEVDGVC